MMILGDKSNQSLMKIRNEIEKENNRMISESFDLMYGALELSSGSTRLNNKNILLKT